MPEGLTNDSAIFGYHAHTGVIRTFMDRERASGTHWEHNLPGGKSNVKREIRIPSATAATRSKSESSLTPVFPSPPFSYWPKFPATIADDSAQSGSQHGKVGNLFIAGGTYQSWAGITIKSLLGFTGHFESGQKPPHSLVEKTPEKAG
jgi:hypothetical protein